MAWPAPPNFHHSTNHGRPGPSPLAKLEGRPEFDSRLGTAGRSVPLSLQAMRRWREASANVLYECDWMIVCMLENMKNKQKEWHTATKPYSSG
jgi:hypothetical protein